MFDLNILVARASVLAIGAVALICSGCSGDPPASGRRPFDQSAGGTSGGAAGQGGTSGVGGVGGANAAAGTGGFGVTAGVSAPAGTGGGDDRLSVHIEDSAQLAVEIVTVTCPGECVEVKAVATGGQPEYHFTWEDGSTSPTRMLCPSMFTKHEVTVTDTGHDSDEFGHEMETARASVNARALDCSPPETPPDAGAGDECATGSECAAGQTCFEGVCVGEGGLRFSLSWNQDTDLDLFVRMPDGVEISFIFPNRGGGMLDVDDCFGECRVPGGPHVENIFFGDAPPRGTYTYWVVNSGAVTPDAFRLEVSAEGVVQATQMGMLAAFAPSSPRYTFEY